MSEEKIAAHQLTVRMAEELFQETKMEADKIGSSHNSYLMLMIKLGMKLYNSEITISPK